MTYEALDAKVIQYGRLQGARPPLRSTRLPVASWLGLAIAVMLIVAAAVTLSLSPGVSDQQISRIDPAEYMTVQLMKKNVGAEAEIGISPQL